VDVASDKAHNAHRNKHYGLDGHRNAVYRYGERLETEAALHAASYRPVTPVRPRCMGTCPTRAGTSPRSATRRS